MSEKKRRWRLFSWISPQHRLVVINDGSFREESSLRLSVRNALFITLAFVALWLLSAFALARLIGGSGDPYKADAAAVANMSEDDIRQQLLQIHRQLDSLESEIVTRDIYIDKIQKVLNNNVETEKDIKSKREQLAQLDTNQPRVGSKEMPEKNEAVRKMMQTTAIDADIANAEPQPSSPSNASSSSNTSADFANAIVRLEQISFLPPLRGIISDTFSASV